MPEKDDRKRRKRREEDKSLLDQLLDLKDLPLPKEAKEEIARAQETLSQLPEELYSRELQEKIRDQVFNWKNKSTEKPAFDAFTKLTKGYSDLSKTFTPKQKELAEQADFDDNLGAVVGLMRKQIETSEQEAKTQSRRFWASTIIALISVVIAIVAILVSL